MNLRLIWVLAFSFLAATASFAAGLADHADFKQGKTLYEDLEFEQALFRFQKASVDSSLSSPDRAQVMVWTAMCYAGIGDEKGAKRSLDDAVSFDLKVVLPGVASPKFKGWMLASKRAASQKAKETAAATAKKPVAPTATAPTATAPTATAPTATAPDATAPDATVPDNKKPADTTANTDSGATVNTDVGAGSTTGSTTGSSTESNTVKKDSTTSSPTAPAAAEVGTGTETEVMELQTELPPEESGIGPILLITGAGIVTVGIASAIVAATFFADLQLKTNPALKTANAITEPSVEQLEYIDALKEAKKGDELAIPIFGIAGAVVSVIGIGVLGSSLFFE